MPRVRFKAIAVELFELGDTNHGNIYDITLFVSDHSILHYDLPSHEGKSRFHSPFPTHQIDPNPTR